MQRNPAIPRKPPSKQDLPVSNDATNKSSSKAKVAKPQVLESQSQALKDSTKKRKGRLEESDATNRRQLIDLTGDDSDTPPADQKSTAKAPLPNTRNAPYHGFPSQPPEIRHRAPAPSPTPFNQRYNMSSNGFAGSSAQQASPPDRPTKRARVEDGTEENTSGKMACIEQYHMAPPDSSVRPIRNMPATGNLGLPPTSPSNGASLQLPGHSGPIYELEAIPAKLTNPPTPGKPAENAALPQPPPPTPPSRQRTGRQNTNPPPPPTPPLSRKRSEWRENWARRWASRSMTPISS